MNSNIHFVLSMDMEYRPKHVIYTYANSSQIRNINNYLRILYKYKNISKLYVTRCNNTFNSSFFILENFK